MGRLLIGAGIVLVVLGLVVQMGVPLGRLPGDVRFQRGPSTFYLPLMTCLVISVVLSLLMAVFRR